MNGNQTDGLVHTTSGLISPRLRQIALRSANGKALGHLLEVMFSRLLRETNGYPKLNVLHREHSHGEGGHRVLDEGTPFDLIPVVTVYERLNEPHKDILRVRYEVVMHKNGCTVQNKHRAQMMGVSLSEFNAKLKAAKRSMVRGLQGYGKTVN